MKAEINFEKERETKGAVRYQELDKSGAPAAIGDGAIIGTIYIRKAAFRDGEFPPAIQITLEA